MDDAGLEPLIAPVIEIEVQPVRLKERALSRRPGDGARRRLLLPAVAQQLRRRHMQRPADLVQGLHVQRDLAVFILAHARAALVNGLRQLLKRHAPGLSRFPDARAHTRRDALHTASVFRQNILFPCFGAV